ncbi:MAG: T9SS type A sorting domain-containing protein, partial [Bacteroidota bacterium]
VAIMNIGSNPVNGVPISYQINQGNVVTENLNQNLEPGDTLIYEFAARADLVETGAYQIDAWIDFDADTHKDNDSLIGQPEIVHLPNTPLVIHANQSVRENFQSASAKIYTANTMGLTGILNWDYESIVAGQGQLEVGGETHALKLFPLVEEIDETYENNLIWTINLLEYDPSEGHLSLGFNYLNDTIIPLGGGLLSENKVFVRGNDQDEWLELYTLMVDEAGWQSVEGLNIYNTLLFGGQTPSSSTQVKFSQKDEFGFSIDDLALSILLNLPVDLVNFTAQKTGEDVLLKWDTASEVNNDYFEIELAIGEAAIQNNEFTTIGKINGIGTTSQASHYEFVDELPNKQGNRYYRLKQVDLDGSIAYSPVRLVNFAPIEASILVYPNPFVRNLKLRYTSDIAKPLDIELVDIQGRVIHREQQQVEVGGQDLLINAGNDLAAGVYFLRVAEADRVQTFRLTKI